MDDLADIFPPPIAAAGTETALAIGSWALAALLFGAVVGLWLWHRRLALRAWWLTHRLRRGRRDPRGAAREGLRLMRRAFGPAVPPELDEPRRRLDAGCFGREPPDDQAVADALARLRSRL